MFTFSIILIFLSLKLSEYLVHTLKLHQRFISIPYISSILVIVSSLILKHFFHVTLLVPEFLLRLSLTIFLFCIGFQIATVLNRTYLLRFFHLLVICLVILASLMKLSEFYIGEYQWLFGTIMFAYNTQIVKAIVPIDYIEPIMQWSTVQLLIVFFSTPLFLTLSNRLFKKDHQQFLRNSETDKNIIPIKIETIIIIFISSVIVIVTTTFPFMKELFFFDFVYTMLLGIGYGLYLNTYISKQKTKLFNELGTTNLYIFITLTMLHITNVDIRFITIKVVYLLILKTIFFAGFTLITTVILFKKLTFQEQMVAAVAGWTFILNAPIVCMHGMKTVVNAYGQAPYVLLVIPPIILWLVNYLHLWLSTILLQ
ncbi:hypothetical protein LCL95_07700 [Bacillus timonensis]|nr:hypothetical protein [Bacillus timonensis]